MPGGTGMPGLTSDANSPITPSAAYPDRPDLGDARAPGDQPVVSTSTTANSISVSSTSAGSTSASAARRSRLRRLSRRRRRGARLEPRRV